MSKQLLKTLEYYSDVYERGECVDISSDNIFQECIEEICRLRNEVGILSRRAGELNKIYPGVHVPIRCLDCKWITPCYYCSINEVEDGQLEHAIMTGDTDLFECITDCVSFEEAG
jgi:hypothetical protein